MASFLFLRRQSDHAADVDDTARAINGGRDQRNFGLHCLSSRLILFEYWLFYQFTLNINNHCFCQQV